MSDLRPGYKLTEVGVIPATWDVTTLGECGAFTSGTGFPLAYQGKPTGHYPFLKVSDFSHPLNSQRMEASNHWISEDVRKQLGAKVHATEALVFAKIGAAIFLERKRLLTHDSCIDNNMMSFDVDRRVGWPPFFQYRFQTMAFGDIVAASALPTLSAKDLKAIEIPLPPLPEQRLIAGTLGDADAVIGALEALIAKKRDINQGAMRELLTGKRRLPGFEREWVLEPVGSIFDFGRTIPLSRAQLSDDGSIKYVHYGDIHTSLRTHLDFETTTTPSVGKALCGAATPLRVGDWVFADASEDYDGVAKAVEITNLPADKDAVAGLHTMLLRERATTFAPGFKGYLSYAPSFRAQVVRAATGTKVFGISKTQMKEIELYFPPIIDEQSGIVAVLSDMDAEIAALEDKLAKARAVKQGMMQVLLTGEVRLA